MTDITSYGRFRVDEKYAEHTCCWGTAIVIDRPYGSEEKVMVICECNKRFADMICEALNKSLEAEINQIMEEEGNAYKIDDYE
jgi:hypothetical protein